MERNRGMKDCIHFENIIVIKEGYIVELLGMFFVFSVIIIKYGNKLLLVSYPFFFFLLLFLLYTPLYV